MSSGAGKLKYFSIDCVFCRSSADAFGPGGGNGLVEKQVDLGGQLVGGDIERAGKHLVLVELGQFGADARQELVDGRHGFAIDTGFKAELVGEDLDQLECRRGRSAREIQDHGVDDVHAVEHGHQHRGQAEPGRAVGMEVDGDAHIFFQGADELAGRGRVDEPGHVLDGDHVGAQAGQLFGLGHEVVDSENFPRDRLARQQRPGLVEPGEFRVHGVADGAVGAAAVLLDVADGRLHVVDVVQGVEDAHDADAGLDGVAAEALDDLVGIRVVAEQVAAARQGGELGGRTHGRLDLFQALPGIFVEIAHDRIGHGTAPDLHGVETGRPVKGQQAVDLVLVHARGELGLLSVPEGQVADQYFLSH